MTHIKKKFCACSCNIMRHQWIGMGAEHACMESNIFLNCMDELAQIFARFRPTQRQHLPPDLSFTQKSAFPVDVVRCL